MALVKVTGRVLGGCVGWPALGILGFGIWDVGFSDLGIYKLSVNRVTES